MASGPASDVLFGIDDGRFTSVTASAEPGDAVRLPGVVLPGFANAHSHAFHRALRGRTRGAGGTFWTWREHMYALAERLDPQRYLALARATYAEMALAGITSVGEFHYLHHAPGGVPYDDPNAMAEALRSAAADAGVRLTLLDTCYLSAGVDREALSPVQQRFADGSAERWAQRAASVRPSAGMAVGAAIHSVRAVPRDQLPTVVRAAEGRPLHMHVSEQPAENDACVARYGVTPVALLHEAGALGPLSAAVHATHVSGDDIALLGDSAITVCLCPTTERDLADGIGPARLLRDAGCPLALGSDQHVVIDLMEEARVLEGYQRLISLQRGRFAPSELVAALTRHAALGWTDAGRIEPGARADLVAVRLDTVRTAGVDPSQAVFAATTADVDTVLVDGQLVVTGGQHRLGDVAALLADAIEPLWRVP